MLTPVGRITVGGTRSVGVWGLGGGQCVVPFVVWTNNLKHAMLDPASAKSLASNLFGNDAEEAGDGAASTPQPPVAQPARTPAVPGYEVLERLGAGGMGVVHKARQLSTGRLVAIKFLRANLPHDSPAAAAEAAKRLVHEARVLGELKHPGIATILDAGWTSGDAASGRVREPFVVMELVQGVPITTACRNLSPRAVVTLFLDVCAAIEHAHVKGVIHRDLKPSNILTPIPPKSKASASEPVADVGIGGVGVKVVDFGLASLIDREAQHSRSQQSQTNTLFSGVAGTLAYMGPDQFDLTPGAPRRPDTRDDVYALGAVLYELLAGRPAYDIAGLPPAVAVRVMAEHPPPPLNGTETGPGALPRELPLIVGKAMERLASERYQSVAEFAADLRRFLDDRPILARAPSPLRRLRLWVRRNRALAAAIAFAGLSLAAAAGGIGVFVARNRELRLEAEDKAREAERDRLVASTVASLLERIVAPAQSSPLSREAGAADALDAAANEFENDPPPQPQSRAAVAQALAMAYLRLGLGERAEAFERKAAKALEEIGGARTLERADAHARLAALLTDLGRTDEAVAEAQLGYDAVASLKPATSPEHAAASLALGRALLADDRADDAEPLLEHASASRVVNANGAVTLDLIALRVAQDRPRDALALLDRFAAAAGNSASALVSLASLRVRVLTDLDEFDEALPIAQSEINRLVPLVPPGHPRLLRARLALAELLIEWGRPAEAQPVLRVVMENDKLLSPAHPVAVRAALLAYRALADDGLADDAAALLWSAVTRLDPANPKHTLAILQLRETLAKAAKDAGDIIDAARIADDAEAMLATPPLPTPTPTAKRWLERVRAAAQ